MNTIQRKKCIFCDSKKLEEVFEHDIIVPQGITMTSHKEEGLWMNYNIQLCSNCKTYQNKYLANLDQIYKNSHISPVGKIRSSMDLNFSKLINLNNDISGIIEIGAGKGYLSDLIVNKNYYIIDPSYKGKTVGKKIIYDYVENCNLEDFEANTIVMSHVFEHYYNPLSILKRIFENKNIKYVYICHPDFDSYTTYPYTYNILHCEHTFYIENDFIIKYFNKNKFKLVEKINHEQYSVFFSFERNNYEDYNINLKNISTITKFNNYINSIKDKVKMYNEILNIGKKVYIWPCSVHSVTLFNHGLDYKKLSGILDNSNEKIGKYVYGYNIKCISFNEIVNENTNDEKIVLMNGGCYNSDIDTSKYSKIKFIT